MNTSYLIPFTENPPIKTYPGYAFVLSLLFAKSNKYFPWLLNQYILAMGNNNGTRYEFVPLDPFHVSEGVMQYLSTSISSDLLHDDRIFFDYVSAMLRQGFGIVCCMNERHIPNRHAYQRYDFDHDNMIVGYNKQDRTTMIMGYSSSGVFSITTVPLTHLVAALINSQQVSVRLNFIRPQEGFSPSFSFDAVRNGMLHYYNSTHIEQLGFSEFYGISGWVMGLDATRKLAQFPIKECQYYDVRLFSFLKDRVKLMYERVKFMVENKYINCGEMELSNIAHALELANLTHLLTIKHNMGHSNNYVDKISHNVNKIASIEQQTTVEIFGIR